MFEELAPKNRSLHRVLLEIIQEVDRRNAPGADESSTKPDQLIETRRLLDSAVRPFSKLRDGKNLEEEEKNAKKSLVIKEFDATARAIKKDFTLIERDLMLRVKSVTESAYAELSAEFAEISERLKELGNLFRDYKVTRVVIPDPGSFRQKVASVPELEVSFQEAISHARNLETIRQVESRFSTAADSEEKPIKEILLVSSAPRYSIATAFEPLVISAVLGRALLDVPNQYSNATTFLVKSTVLGSVLFLIMYSIGLVARTKIWRKEERVRDAARERARFAEDIRRNLEREAYAEREANNVASIKDITEKNRSVLERLNRSALIAADVALSKFEGLSYQANAEFKEFLAPHIAQRDPDLVKLAESRKSRIEALEDQSQARLRWFAAEIDRVDRLLVDCLAACDQSLENWCSRNSQISGSPAFEPRIRVIPAPRKIRIGSYSVKLGDT